MCSQNDSDKGKGSDRWNWADHFFVGDSQFDLKEPEVNYGSASCDGNVDTDADERIFPGCPLTLNLNAVLIMEFLVHHKISQKAAEDIVELLSAHFPPGHKMFTSLYRLKSHWRKQSAMSKYEKRLVCSNCDIIMQEDEQHCGHPECLGVCRPFEFLVLKLILKLLLDSYSSVGILIKVVISVIVFFTFYCRPCFCSQLLRNFEEQSLFSDITSWSSYRYMTRIGYTQTPWNITLTLNTDRVSIFKTSRSGSLWPVYLTVDELSPKSR